MDERIEETLQQCLENMENGQSLEECLAQFPDEANRLELLLQSAASVRDHYSHDLSSGTRTRMRNRVMHEWDLRNQRQHRSLLPLFLPRMAAVATSVILLVVFAGMGTVAAAGNAVSGDHLYPIKQIREEAQLQLARSPEARVELLTRLVKERAKELQKLAAKEEARTGSIASTIDRINRHLLALDGIVEEKVSANDAPTDVDFLESLEYAVQGQQSAQAALEEISERTQDSQPDLGAAIDSIQRAQERVHAAIEAAGGVRNSR